MAKKSKSNIADVVAFMNRIQGDASARVRSANEETAKKLADDIFKVSRTYVPVEYGELQASGKVIKESDGSYRIEYGEGLERPYAFYVHENIPKELPKEGANTSVPLAEGKAKNYTKPGTGPKYLERAAIEVATDKNIVKYLRDALGIFRSRKLK